MLDDNQLTDSLSPNFFFMQRFTPVSPTKSVMRYEVYRHKDATDEAFNLISNMYKRIMSEDKYLCIHTQKNLNAGVFVNGLLHPEMEMGPLHFQSTVREVVTEHFSKEQDAGHEIWPAKPVVASAVTGESDIAFRTGMDTYADADNLQESLTGNLAPAIVV
jgi:hypothetical protein